MDYKKIAGDRIRQAREAKGLSRPQLAAMIKGLQPSTLGNYELGLRYPSPQNLAELSKILGEPACYLSAIETDPNLIELLRTYYKLDSRGKRTLYRVAESESSSYQVTPTTLEE